MTSHPASQGRAPARLAETLPLGVVLARAGTVLSDLAGVALSVQGAITDSLPGHGVTRQAIIGLQGIDRITQVVADIARLLEDAAGMIPEGLEVDPVLVLHRVSLAELSQRIGDDPAATQGRGRRAIGDVTLF